MHTYTHCPPSRLAPPHTHIFSLLAVFCFLCSCLFSYLDLLLLCYRTYTCPVHISCLILRILQISFSKTVFQRDLCNIQNTVIALTSPTYTQWQIRVRLSVFNREPWKVFCLKGLCVQHCLTFTSIMQIDLLLSSANKLLTLEILNIYRLDRLAKGFLTPSHWGNECTLSAHLSNQESHPGQYLRVRSSVSTSTVVFNSLLEKFMVNLSFCKSIFPNTLSFQSARNISSAEHQIHHMVEV